MKKTTSQDMQKKIAEMIDAITGYCVNSSSDMMKCGEADGKDNLVHTIYNPVEVTDWSENHKYYVEYFPTQNTVMIYELIPHQGYKVTDWICLDRLNQAQAVAKVAMVVDRLFR